MSDKTTGEVVYITDRARLEARLSRVPVEDLNRLWEAEWPVGDVWEGGEWSGLRIEQVHAELNRRGEGRYCAV